MFLKILVFLMISYWVLKVFRQLFPPSYEPNQVQQEREKAYREYLIRKKREEGKVTLESKSKTAGHGSADKGEYVDFEEIR